MSQTQLSVNVNKIALIRNSRGENLPNLLQVVKKILESGALGITVHPRPDARHIRPQDTRDLRDLLSNHYPEKELNIEGNPFHVPHPKTNYPGFIELVLETKPDQVTLVPDSVNQLTSNHGWNLPHDHYRLSPLINQIKKTSSSSPSSSPIRVSLFINPDTPEEELKIAKEIGADRIELYTDQYAKLYEKNRKEEAISSYQQTTKLALSMGLEVNAGHALSLTNLGFFNYHLPYLKEVSIGHALVCESLYDGLVPVVKQYLKILSKNTPSLYNN